MFFFLVVTITHGQPKPCPPGKVQIGPVRTSIRILAKFRSILFNFPVPERYAYLSGSWKMKMAEPKVEGTRTVGSISTKSGLYQRDSLVPSFWKTVKKRKKKFKN